MSKSIHINKADFTLPIIQIQHRKISKIRLELEKQVSIHNDALLVPCVLDIDNDVVAPTFLAQLVELLRQFNFLPIGLKTENTSLTEQALYAGLAIFNEEFNQPDMFEPIHTHISFDETHEHKPASNSTKVPMVYKGTVSSEQQVYAQGCDLIVLGDVEQGAEVVADGSIYIGGTLLGKAYAGNDSVKEVNDICVRAYVFEPQLVSIAGFYQVDEDISSDYRGLPIEVRFDENRLTYHLE